MVFVETVLFSKRKPIKTLSTLKNK